jgi:hypothetical protein
VFTDHKNNRFQKTLINNAEHEDMNIRPAPPNYQAGGATVVAEIEEIEEIGQGLLTAQTRISNFCSAVCFMD